MAQVTPLYQIGGFRAHTSGLPEDLAQRLCPSKGGVELTLGVLPSGATYVLLREDYFLRIFRRSRDRPWLPSHFRSLSPVYFETQEALARKLDLYTSNKKTKNGPPRDRSKANTAYTADESGALSHDGELRADFELQRVFYRCCTGQLSQPALYGVTPAVASRLQSIKIVSFSFTLWSSDKRPLKDRIADPKILDLCWTEYDLLNSSSELKVVSCSHWYIKENSLLGNPGSKRLEFKHGSSESLAQKEAASRLQKLSSGLLPNVMLLVHDTNMTRQVLTALGVNISLWQHGLYDVFAPPPSSNWDSSRSRSRSPQRNPSRDPRRPRSPVRPAEPTAKPVYVDIQKMFGCLKQVPLSNITINSSALDLKIKDESLDPLAKGWCAGNEGRLLGYIWNAMASENSIDDQRIARWSSFKRPTSLATGADEDTKDTKPSTITEDKPAPETEMNDDSDSDYDPNDVQPTGPLGGHIVDGVEPVPSATAGNGPVYNDPYDELEDDDDW